MRHGRRHWRPGYVCTGTSARAGAGTWNAGTAADSSRLSRSRQTSSTRILSIFAARGKVEPGQSVVSVCILCAVRCCNRLCRLSCIDATWHTVAQYEVICVVQCSGLSVKCLVVFHVCGAGAKALMRAACSLDTSCITVMLFVQPNLQLFRISHHTHNEESRKAPAHTCRHEA